MYSLYIHTRRNTTPLAKAAIFKPLWLLTTSGHMPTAETHSQSSQGPFPFSSFIKGFICIPQLTDQSEEEIFYRPAALKYSVISGH